MSDSYVQDVNTILDGSIGKVFDQPDLLTLPLKEECSWNEIKSYYLTNAGGHSLLSAISGNEGSQQEEIGLWFLDSISESGAAKNPLVYENDIARELSDLIVSYSEGCFLVESKCLAVLTRENIPDRNKLIKDIQKHIDKAISQLRGACRNIKSGNKVTDLKGKEIQIIRNQPMHCIALVPDLSLLSEVTSFGKEMVREFARDTGSFLQILDPHELRMCVGNALRLSDASQTITPAKAFDSVLLMRLKLAAQTDSPYFRYLIKLTD